MKYLVSILLSTGLALPVTITLSSPTSSQGPSGADPSTTKVVTFDAATTHVGPYLAATGCGPSSVASYQCEIAGNRYVDYFWDGSASPIVGQPDVALSYLAPLGDTSQYLTVGSPGLPSKVTILPLMIDGTGTPIGTWGMTYFGLYWGSPDIGYTDNQVTIFDTKGNILLTEQGDELRALAGNPDCSIINNCSRYINFFADPNTPFGEIQISASSPAFETDNHAFSYAIPEPSGIALGGVGLFVISVWARRRKTS